MQTELLYQKNEGRTCSRRRWHACLEQIRQLEREGKVFVFRPSEDIAISRLEKNPAHLELVYELGLKDATAQWQALEEYLAK